MPTKQQELSFQIEGLDCANCALTVEQGVSRLPGVAEAQLNFNTARLRVQGEVQPGQVIERVEELGYGAIEPEGKPGSKPAAAPALNFWQFMWQRLATRLALLGALLILPGVILEELLGWHHPLINLASVGALVAAGWPVAQSAWRAVRINRRININVLMTIAAVGAVIIGEYTEAGLVMVLFALGEALEGFTGSRARNAIRSLVELIPDRATLLRRDGKAVEEQQLPVDELQPGDVILVKPGEQIPMDGRVAAGASAVNQAPITGESRLIDKEPGAEVFASSINGQGSLEIKVTRRAENNTISRLIQMVEEAQEKQAPAQRFIDRFAHYYTPAVVVLAGLVAVIPPLFFGQPFLNPDANTFGWLYRGLALLVVACPCALVISTPVSIISAISNAARNGVLIKGGAYLEQLSQVQAIALDKTGTLTAGTPSVVQVHAVDCRSPNGNGVTEPCGPCDDLVALASAIERRSEHPLAQAIVDEAYRLGVEQRYPAAEGVTALSGRGVTGRIEGREVTIGSHPYFEQHIPHQPEDCAVVEEAARQGQTPMMISAEGKYLGMVSVADTVRQSSQEAMSLLKETGLQSITMLTGDNKTTAQTVAGQVGVTDVQAELLPENKVAAVTSLQQKYGRVAMVGDGINDAPALAQADVGIAIGAASGGTTQAMETADITLMSDDLRQLPFAVKLSRAAMRTIKANVALSIGIKLVFVVLVLLGWGTMWMAVLADMGTSLLVTLNGMRLLGRPVSPVGNGGETEGS